MIMTFARHPVLRFATIVMCVLAVAACSSKKKNTRLQGERLSVLTFERTLDADQTLAGVRVALPRPYLNKNWPQAGGSKTNVLHHLAIAAAPRQVWRASVSTGSQNYERMVSAPVVANGVVYVIDARAEVAAFSAESGNVLWRTSLKVSKKKEKSKVGFGGGVAYAGGTLYVTTGYGSVVALEAGNGRQLWRKELGLPIRGAPGVSSGRVFVVTFDNQLFALSATSGDIIWDYVGIVEDAGVLGAASPAISGDTVVVGFSSGELIAFRAENGQIAWQDALSRTGRLTALATLSDIDGQPVIDRGRVYAINHSGRMVAIDMRSGERVWESNIGSLYTPWVAGDYIFIVTVDAQVAALSIRDGRVHWVTKLQRFKNTEKRKGVIRWSGPVLAGDRLFITSSHGYILTISPYTGDILSGEKMSDGTVIPPIVVDGTMYVLTDDGKLTAYR